MAKNLRCSNFIPGCTFVATGKTQEEVFHHASEHVRLKHKFREMSPEVIAVIHGAIVEDEPARESRAHPQRNAPENLWHAAREKRA
jgi:predicted small metal-binding protein